MTLKHGYGEIADTVVLTMSRRDYQALTDALRLLVGVGRVNRDPDLAQFAISLADRLNEGNRGWVPLESKAASA